jgi:hypothetical protein
MNLVKLSNKKLNAEHLKLQDKISIACQSMIDNGLGHFTISELRAVCDPSDVVKNYLNLLDLDQDIRSEAERRFGPDGLFELRYQR